MQLVNLIKPTHVCNLACTYCYNDDERAPMMSEAVLERTIQQTFEFASQAASYEEIEFFWHGGEPMTVGLEFYKKAVTFQKKYCGDIKYKNNMQTNGVLIRNNWIEFFKENNFHIGISIDGPQHLHDKYRVTHSGQGTFDKVYSAIKTVQSSGLNFGVVLVISKATLQHVGEIYSFLAENNLPFNFNPTNRSGGAREAYDELGLDAQDFGDAWIKMYDLWFDSNPKFVFVQDFAAKTRAVIYGRGSECTGLSQCGNSTISTDPIGDIYPCGSLSGHADTRYGNIMEHSLHDLMQSSTAANYRYREVDEHCNSCKWQHVCHGGCPARAYKFYNDYHHRDYYCPSLYRIFEHIEKRLLERGIEKGEPHPEHMDDGMTLLIEEAKRLAAKKSSRMNSIAIIQL